MRQLHSDFHFRHALFALQCPDGYVDALLEAARDGSASRPATTFSPRGAPAAAWDRSASFVFRRLGAKF
ncbi:MAG TPA: hypothetical protein VN715_06695 [Roseiarcus sp.]|nr:hypothetical protein [Roseiarcus sp.]